MLVEALVKANETLGVSLMKNCEAKSIRIENGRILGIDTFSGFIAAPRIIVSVGAWTSNIGSTAAEFAPIQLEPVRGEMLCFKPGPSFVRHVIYSSRGYLVPRRDGRLLAGSTSEYAGFDKRVTHRGIESIKSMAFEIAPKLSAVPVADSWAGFRPHAADDSPVLGAVDGVEGLFYATGHYRNGILLAPITAKIMAEAMSDTLSADWLEVFSPNRFHLAATTR